MSILSFDNMSSEHLGSPMKLKFTPTTIYFKNDKTGKTSNFESKIIKTTEWLYRARGFGLCIKLHTNKRHYFDGFAENEFEKVSQYFQDHYNVQVKNVETCLKGWNWGRPKFEDEYMEFMIDGMRSFDINLKNVINATINKNELTLQFQTSEEAFSISEMRFATVSNNENVMQDFYRNVMKVANILETSGDAIVSLKEMHCLQPRGRYEIKFYPQFIHLRGKTYDYSVPRSNFVRFYLLPHPDERQIFFVLQVNPPITHGQTRYHFIILLFKNEEEIELMLNCSDQILAETYNNSLARSMSGLTYEVVTKLFKNLYDQKLTVPNKFESKQKSRALACSYKTTSGFLYPLDKGFIFVPKPAVSIRSDEITLVNVSRASSMHRTFDFDIETTSGIIHTFSSIDKSEFNGFFDFIKSKKYILNSGESQAHQDDWSSSDESHDGYLEHMKAVGKWGSRDIKMVHDLDEDDEDNEDFNPEDSNDSDVVEEYDSEVEISASSTDDESGDNKGAIAQNSQLNRATARDSSDESSTEERPKKTKESTKKPVAQSKGNKKASETTKVSKKRPDSTRYSIIADGGKQQKKKPKDPNAPKKPLTAFLLFSNDVREKVKRSLPPGSSIGEVSKAIGERWKTVPDSEKMKYAEQYKVEHRKYLETIKKYEKSGLIADRPIVTVKKGEITSKLSAGVFKSEEFVQSSNSSG